MDLKTAVETRAEILFEGAKASDPALANTVWNWRFCPREQYSKVQIDLPEDQREGFRRQARIILTGV